MGNKRKIDNLVNVKTSNFNSSRKEGESFDDFRSRIKVEKKQVKLRMNGFKGRVAVNIVK